MNTEDKRVSTRRNESKEAPERKRRLERSAFQWAETALWELSEQTGLPMRQIASSLITQAAACVDIIEAD